MVLNKEFLQDRRESYDRMAEETRSNLESGKFADDKRRVDQKCGELDARLENRTLTSDQPTPLGNQRTIRHLDQPTAMEKVEVELEKQKQRRPFERKIAYYEAKHLLKIKEEEYSTYETEGERNSFSAAVGMDQNRKTILDYEERLEKEKRKKETKQKAREGLNNDAPQYKAAGQAVDSFNDENTLQRADINHHGQKWTYEKRGRAESMTISGFQGDNLVSITQADQKQKLNDVGNARVAYKGDKQGGQREPGDLEVQMRNVRPYADQLKAKDDKERQSAEAKKEFNRVRLQGKPTVEFNASQNIPPSRPPAAEAPEPDNPAPAPEDPAPVSPPEAGGAEAVQSKKDKVPDPKPSKSKTKTADTPKSTRRSVLKGLLAKAPKSKGRGESKETSPEM